MAGKKRFTEARILQILKEVEEGASISDVCRRHGILQLQYYQWRVRYGGMEAAALVRLRHVEAENARLKKMVVENQLMIDSLLDRLSKRQT